MLYRKNGELIDTIINIGNLDTLSLKSIVESVYADVLSKGYARKDTYFITGKQLKYYNAFLVYSRKIKGLLVLSDLIFREIDSLDDKGEILAKVKEIMSIRLPDPTKIFDEISGIINSVLNLDFVKYSLELRESRVVQRVGMQYVLGPYGVIDHDDGIKRAIVSAFQGDVVDAFRLALGALNHKMSPEAVFLASYLGYQLRIYPYTYSAPDINYLKDILEKIQVSSETLVRIRDFLLLLIEGLDDFSKAHKALTLLRSNVDKCFRILDDENENVFIKDIIAYILITYEPAILSSQKIERLINYVGDRSFLLTSYLRASIDRLRMWSLVLAIDIPWKDIVGNIRRLKSQFINSKMDLYDLIKKYELNLFVKKVRENIIGAFLSLIGYVRLLYWSMTLSMANADDLREFLPEAIYDSLDVLKMITEALPPVDQENIIDAVYLTALISYLLGGMGIEDIETPMRSIATLAQTVYEIISDNLDKERVKSTTLIKILSLAWIISIINLNLDEISPFMIKMLDKAIPKLGSVISDMKQHSIDKYLLTLFFSKAISVSLLKFINVESGYIYNSLRELIDMFYNFIKIGAFLPLLGISVLDIISKVGWKIRDPEQREFIKKEMSFLKESLVKEELSPIIKNIINEINIF